MTACRLGLAAVLLTACAPRLEKSAGNFKVDGVERAAIVERASRGRVRLLEPPAAPDFPSTVVARPAPQRAQKPAVRAAQPQPAVAGDVWTRLAQCESGGNPRANTGNGFYGLLQFSLATWRSVGGSGLPSDAPADEQITRAKVLQARSGWGQWPACSRKLGLR